MENRRSDGGSEWLTLDGELHRDGDLPAIEYADGDKEWWAHGQLHREGDLPAIECARGDKEWWVRDRLHREGGLPAIEHVSGNREWRVRGQHHKISAPATERHNYREFDSYWIYGRRVDGPRWFIRGGWRDRSWCALLIQQWWRRTIIDPQYVVARRRLRVAYDKLLRDE